jgi:hypothetical protein
MPNPWPPDNIDRLIEIAVTTAGLSRVVYKLIALWIEDRKARKIKIKHGDFEVHIEGRVSDKEIARACSTLRKVMKKSGNDDLEIILPSGVDRAVPIEMIHKLNQKKDAMKKGSKK